MHRDLWRLRGQLLSIALAVACGVATVVSLGSTYAAIEAAGERFYREHRFADVFVSLARAPSSLVSRIEAIPGVAAAEGRVVQEVMLDVPRLDEPATGRLISFPDGGAPRLNLPYLRRGRPLAPGARNEVLLGERFAEVNGLGIGDTLGAVINGRHERLRIVGIVLSPEYVLEATREQIFMDNRRFAVLWMSQAALGGAYGMEHAFNDLALALAPGAREAEVIAEVDGVLAPYGGLGAYGRSEHGSHRILANQLEQSRVSCTLVPALFLAIA
ncbi:MAG TPA: ABC transporter permease, partial [Longimicrobiaceae bacterium]|nr:ABC transporter permease [Longimicrobiaceae bacterium]